MDSSAFLRDARAVQGFVKQEGY